MKPRSFHGSFTQQEAIPEEGIAAAVNVMRSGRLHRYNVIDGEEPEASALEREFAAWQGARYCLAVASGGQAMQIAMRAAGVRAGDTVLTNAFTLAPVPGAIIAVGARPILLEITDDLVIDFNDLTEKARSSGARFLLLSLMRGHLCDMDRLTEVVRELGIQLIEDCAHTMGAHWNQKRSGSFGLAACFSTQTYKHLNSGEGGLLTTDDADVAARAVILSGSYMLYESHGAAPDADVFQRVNLETPNMSARMDNVRAAMLRPQLLALDANIERWNELYFRLASHLVKIPGFRLAHRQALERHVGSSIQFMIPEITEWHAQQFVAAARAGGVELKWFGAPVPSEFTSNHHSWTYMVRQHLPETDRILSGLFDMRLPLTFTLDDCDTIAGVIAQAIKSRAMPPKVAGSS